ncbi:MAG TPA: sigma-54 dependent transcriptional regulator [bacterium]|nr:sigma-54 dependent transcriptional regulator [bacterium]HPR87109.1 sigma-54 dependent transcriptional regulator [bacterium]
METRTARLLIVDDEKRMCAVLREALATPQLAVTTAESGEAAWAAISLEHFDVIVSDIKMAGMSGLELLKKVKAAAPETEVLLMTAYADARMAVEAMKSGAFDYIIKPFEIEELRLKVRNILDKHQLRAENRDLRVQLQERFSLENMVGQSGAMQMVYELVEKVAPTDATVIIRGESGTGKELVARAIHQRSRRSEAPFIAVNCSALPETLLESELFGHEKGAFTGAERQKPGRFELAGAGTIFLDEIGDLSPATQVKLLRVLQQREFSRLGGTETLKMQARILTATNRDLEEAVRSNLFREDLYYRVNVFPIHLPPLRDRSEDIPDLVSHFLSLQKADAAGIDAAALQSMMAYRWPGNVRELENIIERALILSGGKTISRDDLPAHIRGQEEGGTACRRGGDELPTLDEMERHLIERAIARAEGNKSKAARLLGITRRQLYSRMERWENPEESEKNTGEE